MTAGATMGGGRFLIASALCAGVLGLAGPALPSAAAPEGGAVPVAGRAWLTASRLPGQPRVHLLVHGVRRIEGGTVLYYSVGAPPGGSAVQYNDVIDPVRWSRGSIFGGGSGLVHQVLVDLADRRAYGGAVAADGTAIASPTQAWRAEPGRFHVLYHVFPELPGTTRRVDVIVGQGTVIADLPVTAGALEPSTDQRGPLPLGGPWPRIDQARVAGAVQEDTAVVPVDLESADLERTVVERESADEISVDLAADVLFAVDSARLTAAATAKIEKAAATVNQRAASGAVQVVGHTDSTGTDAHNDDLSRRRARAVADALRPLVTVDGLSFQVEGRGEREPVDDNATAEGRKANRRVSIVFVPKESS